MRCVAAAVGTASAERIDEPIEMRPLTPAMRQQYIDVLRRPGVLR